MSECARLCFQLCGLHATSALRFCFQHAGATKFMKRSTRRDRLCEKRPSSLVQMHSTERLRRMLSPVATAQRMPSSRSLRLLLHYTTLTRAMPRYDCAAQGLPGEVPASFLAIVHPQTLTDPLALRPALRTFDLQYGRVGNVEKLLNEGADVRGKNHWNANCLHWVSSDFHLTHERDRHMTGRPDLTWIECGCLHGQTVKGFVHNQGEDGYDERKASWVSPILHN